MIFVVFFVCLFVLSLETGFLCLALAILELTLRSRLALNSTEIHMPLQPFLPSSSSSSSSSFFWNRISILCSPGCEPGWPWTYKDPPVSSSWVLGLKIFTTLFSWFHLWNSSVGVLLTNMQLIVCVQELYTLYTSSKWLARKSKFIWKVLSLKMKSCFWQARRWRMIPP